MAEPDGHEDEGPEEVDRDAPTLVGSQSGPHTPIAEAQLASGGAQGPSRASASRAGTSGGGRMASSRAGEVTISTHEDVPEGGRRRLGDFELVRKIGQGGMGEVWLATQVSLDRPVAVKVLPRALASQENFIERFQREAKAAASLVHPNVIQIYAYGIDEGTPYFAMEYVEGEDLQQRMRAVQQLDVREIVEVMLGVGAALRGAHEKGLIHRDIKPSNVMIDRNGVVKVMDFGLAKATSGGSKSLTHAGLIMGTPNYLSPEQGRGDPLDGRSDLYSLGVVMYELLTGTLPFRADTPAGLIFKHVYEPPPSPKEIRPDVPPFLVEVTLKLLEKDPDDRYKNAAEFMADLAEFLENWDHYMEGGDRRPNSGFQNPDRVARSGLLSVTATGGVRADKRKSLEEAKNAVTEGVENRRLSQSRAGAETAEKPDKPARGRDTRETVREKPPRDDSPDPEVAEPAAAAPATGLPPPYHQSRKFERPKRREAEPAGRGPWIVLGLLVLVGGGYGLHRTRPDLTGRALAVVGLGGATTKGPQPGESGWGSPATVALVFSRALPQNVTISLRGPASTYKLEPGTRESYPPGTYDLIYERRGYEPFTLRGLTLLKGEGDTGVLVDVHGSDAKDVPLEWVPTQALQGAYQRGRELLEKGQVERALDQLRAAVDLDPSYAPSQGAQTALELLEQAGSTRGQVELSDGQLEAALGRAREALEARRWRAALQELESKGLAERRADAWRDLEGRAKDGVSRGNGLVADVESAVTRGRFAEAGEKLTRLGQEDPDNPERGRLSERVTTGKQERQLALDPNQPPAAARTRLQDYLARWGREDPEARQRLQEVEAQLLARDERKKLEEQLERLRQAGSWEQVIPLANELLAKEPGNERAQSALREARREQKRGEIVSAFQALDAALQAGEPDRLAALFDLGSGDCQRELATFRRFLNPAIAGQLSETQHLLPAERIELDDLGRAATVRTEWVFKVQVLDQPARQLRLAQEVRLRHDGARWLFTSFRVPEGEKPSAPH